MYLLLRQDLLLLKKPRCSQHLENVKVFYWRHSFRNRTSFPLHSVVTSLSSPSSQLLTLGRITSPVCVRPMHLIFLLVIVVSHLTEWQPKWVISAIEVFIST